MRGRNGVGTWALRGVFVGVALFAAACSGGGVKTTPIPVPTATPTIAPTSAPTPASIATSVPLAISTGAPGPIATPFPAPTGYTTHVTIPLVSSASGTVTFAFTSSIALPTALPVLQSKTRISTSVRIPQATGNLVPIFFDSIVPSANVTVAGAVSISQGFPAGVLSSSTQYYVGFYDSTQPTPAWQTILGPVSTTDGLNLTLSGNVASFTFQANKLYGFAIFSLSTPSVTPPPAPQTLAYIPNPNGNVVEVSAAAAVATTLPLNAEDLGLDDSGNAYTIQVNTPAPVPSGSPTASPLPPTISKYTAATKAITTYTPSNTGGGFLVSSGAGAFAVIGQVQGTGLVFDVWDPGAGSTPSRTIVENSPPFGIMGHDGTLFTATYSPDGSTITYPVYAASSSTVVRTIPETIVPAGADHNGLEQGDFAPNYSAIGPDGTLYVTEYSFFQPDHLAGLYIYPPAGKETFVATTSDANGAGPEGVDVDASGNVYVMNNNAAYANCNIDPTNCPASGDSLHDIEVFGPGGVGGPNGASSPRHITGNFTGYPIAVAGGGTIFFSSFDSFNLGTGVNASFAVASGTTTVTQITSFGATGFALYDGNRETTGARRSQSIASGVSSRGPGGPRFGAAAIARRIAALKAKRHL